jgi:inorganic phosphate transporter, PiT family
LATTTLLVTVTVLIALCFDFFNGFHDAANSIATVVSTRVLSPRLAVIWAAIFNFIAAFIFGIAVAKTIGSGMIDVHQITQFVVLSGLVGAIVWDILTWWWGLPTSSSHGWTKTLIFIVVAPIMGLVLGWLLMTMMFWIFRNSAPQNVDGWFRRLQLVSAALYSLGHGGNDAQKTMGIVAGALYSAGIMSRHDFSTTWGPFHWPIILAANLAMGLGTYFGGWRIVHTMGSKITKLKPIGGFCAETAGAITLFGTAAAGIPVSTTHTITGAIVGVGATQRLSAVRWGVAGRIVWAWAVTIPASGIVAAALFLVIQWFNPSA